MKEGVLHIVRTTNRVLKKLTGLVLLGPIHCVDLITSLLLVGRTGPKLGRTVKSGRTIHVASAHLIASKANGMPKPLTRQKDRHLDTETCLRVKERRHMIVLQELCNELLIGGLHLRTLLGKTDTSGIHHGKIIAKGLEKFDGAGLKDRHTLLYWLPSK